MLSTGPFMRWWSWAVDSSRKWVLGNESNGRRMQPALPSFWNGLPDEFQLSKSNRMFCTYRTHSTVWILNTTVKNTDIPLLESTVVWDLRFYCIVTNTPAVVNTKRWSLESRLLIVSQRLLVLLPYKISAVWIEYLISWCPQEILSFSYVY